VPKITTWLLAINQFEILVFGAKVSMWLLSFNQFEILVFGAKNYPVAIANQSI